MVVTDLLYHGSAADFAASIRQHGLIARNGGVYLIACAGCAREHAILAACARNASTRLRGAALIVVVEADRARLDGDPDYDGGLVARRGIPSAAIRELRPVPVDPALLDDIGYCEWCASLFAYTKVANARDQAGAQALWPEVSAGRDLYADRHLIRNLDAHTCERVRGRAA